MSNVDDCVTIESAFDYLHDPIKGDPNRTIRQHPDACLHIIGLGLTHLCKIIGLQIRNGIISTEKYTCQRPNGASMIFPIPHSPRYDVLRFLHCFRFRCHYGWFPPERLRPEIARWFTDLSPDNNPTRISTCLHQLAPKLPTTTLLAIYPSVKF